MVINIIAQQSAGKSMRQRLARRLCRVVGALTVGLLTLALAGGSASAQTGKQQYSSYEVGDGDSLSIIAREHGVSLDALASANGISNVHLIKVGQTLNIPNPKLVRYTIVAGDSISVVAKAIGSSTGELMELNNLDDANLIRVGQVLQLPAGSSLAALDPTASYRQLPSGLTSKPERLVMIPSFERWSARYGIDPALLMAVAYRESGWQTDVVSSSGAVGVGQIMPKTGEWIASDLIGEPGLDRWNADDNIRMSARYLSWLQGYMNDPDLAIAAYYQGPGAVQAVGLYDDTIEYVENVNDLVPFFVAE